MVNYITTKLFLPASPFSFTSSQWHGIKSMKCNKHNSGTVWITDKWLMSEVSNQPRIRWRCEGHSGLRVRTFYCLRWGAAKGVSTEDGAARKVSQESGWWFPTQLRWEKHLHQTWGTEYLRGVTGKVTGFQIKHVGNSLLWEGEVVNCAFCTEKCAGKKKKGEYLF